MKSGFEEPNAIKNQRPPGKPISGKGIEFDFRCPQYDERSGAFVNAGRNFGVGIKSPVGHEGNPKLHVDTMPMDRVKTMANDCK